MKLLKISGIKLLAMKVQLICILQVALFAIALLSCQSSKQSSIANTKPNIIFILTEDQGYGDLSCHGNPVLKTSHMDRLHDESVCFTDFMVSI